jgi:hypothetical protein
VSIRTEKRRLGRAFQAALLAAGSPVVVFACGTSHPNQAAPDDASANPSDDVTQTSDASAPTTDGAANAEGADEAAVSDDGDPGDASTSPDADAGPPPNSCTAPAFLTDAAPFLNDASSLPDGADYCAFAYPCGLAGTFLGTSGCQVLGELADGGLAPIPNALCWLPQGGGCDNDAYAPPEDGGVTILCSPCPSGAGRRPVGLARPREARGATLLGAYLASMAFEEDAAVTAFDRMERELAALGAPAELVVAAARAKRDEERHVRAFGKLATAPGREGIVKRARTRRIPRRSASAVAAENASEGCVRETYGALVARWQSVHAGDAELRSAFARIAADEARHAALSWAVARWIEPRLDAAGLKRVARARRRALREIRKGAQTEPSSSLVREAGVPRAREACALLDALGAELSLRG